MAECKLTRVDVRLVHGQIMLYWIRTTGASQILVIDDALAKDEFMAKFYKQSVPGHIKVKILSVPDAINQSKENRLIDADCIILFRDVKTVYRLFKEGFPFSHVQLGNIPNGPGKTTVAKGICLSNEEFTQLEELHQNGIRVYTQQSPPNPITEFDAFAKKIKR